MAKKRTELMREPEFVSQQVSEARRYYLDLNPSPAEPLLVVCGGVERVGREYVVARSDFPYYAIEMVAEGEGTLSLDGHSYPLSVGTTFAYGPKTRHRIENLGRTGMRKYYVDFAGRSAKRLLVPTGLLAGRPVQVTALHELIDVFEAMDREGRDDGPLAQDVCTTLMKLLMLKIKQRSVATGAQVPRAYETYRDVRQQIESDFMNLASAQDIAQACGITPIYLSRLFRRFAGVGAYQFLLRKRMNHAAELLLEEGLLVKEVAERLGFADAFQFSRAFKRVYGVPPRQLSGSRASRRT